MRSRMSMVVLLAFIHSSCNWGDSSVSLEPGEVSITGDCPDRLQSGKSELIKSDGHNGYVLLSAPDFGLPDTNIYFVGSYKLSSSDGPSICHSYIFAADTREILFECSEDSRLVCTVMLRRL